MAEHMQKMLSQAAAMEETLVAAAAALAEEEVEGRSEDGKVKLRLSGAFELVRLRITPGAFEEENLKHLERSGAQASADALAQAHELAARRSAAILGPAPAPVETPAEESAP